VSVSILIGDCRERMAELDAASIDSCVCDPPYHLTSIVKRFGAANAAPAKVGKTGAYARASRGFMGQTWDGGDVAFQPETWAEVLRVLKPGAHLVAFSGTRTYHRMACAIEDAGFEIRDQLAWAYGSGFPKSHDVAKGFDRAADYKLQSAVRRAAVAAVEAAGLELPGNSKHDWTIGEHAPGNKWWAEFQRWLPGLTDEQRERVEGEIVTTVRKAAGWFTRGDIYDLRAPATPEAAQWQGWGTALKPAWEPICLARKPLQGTVAANMAAHGTGAINIDGCRIEGEGNKTFDRGAGDRSREQYRTGTTIGAAKPIDLGRWPANIIHDGSEEVLAHFPNVKSGSLTAEQQAKGGFAGTVNCYGTAERGGSGSYEANEGSAARFFYCAKATTEERGEGNNHPTVKPIDLMRWLCRLVTPKGGTVLDPFAGSGSTLIAADAEQFHAIGCELSSDYAAIAERRIRAAAGLFAEVKAA
jgi:DNA modification methylase